MNKSVIFLIFYLGSAFSPAQGKSTYRLSFQGNKVQVQVNASKRIEIGVPEITKGLYLLTAQSIAEKIGDKAKSLKHPFDFTDPEETQIDVSSPSTHFIFSSFKKLGPTILPKRVSQFVIGIADKRIWNLHEFSFEGTTFQLVGPKLSPQITPSAWEASMRKVWPKFFERFGSATDHLVFVDLKGPISGGPLGENVLAFFADENLPQGVSEEMEANLGWGPQRSTRAYVKAQYPKSQDQWGEYLLGTFSHEISHLYFGFGITRERVSTADELWFSLGLGMLYDMEITRELTGHEPQLLLDVMKHWEEKISRLKDVDQRLIGPDRAADQNHKFDRKKVFGHGKAAYYLKELRSLIGREKFDAAVIQYLRSCGNCDRGYEDFKKFLGPETAALKKLETKLQIR